MSDRTLNIGNFQAQSQASAFDGDDRERAVSGPIGLGCPLDGSSMVAYHRPKDQGRKNSESAQLHRRMILLRHTTLTKTGVPRL